MRCLAPLLAFGFAIAPACVNVDSFAGGGEDGGTSPNDAATSATCDADTQTAIDDCGSCGNRCPVRANGVPECVAGACSTKCNPGFGDCDGNPANGCETSTREDATNCGVCGRSCGGSSCADGKCAPTKLLSGQTGLYSIVSDGDFLYFSSETDGGAYRCPVESCPSSQKIGTGNERSYYLAVDASNVYWNNNSTNGQTAPGKVFFAPKIGGGVTDVLASSPHPSATNPTQVAQAGTQVFWSSNEGTVWRAPKDKSSPPTALTKINNAGHLVIVNDTLYIANVSTETVFSCAITGCATPPPTVASGQAKIGNIASDGTTLFWRTDTDVVSYAPGAGTGALKLTKAAGSGLIAVNGNDLFWSESASRKVLTMPKTGGTPVTLASDVNVNGITADAKYVYWVVRDENAIYKVAR